MSENYICDRLFEMQDTEYRAFHSKLMPTVSKDFVIGVRTPELRKFAKEISKTDYVDAFMRNLPHKYYEENNLHAFLIEDVRDYDRCIAELNRFLPYVDNWATCDCMSPKIFKAKKSELLPHLDRWLLSTDVYSVRFAAKTLMQLYLDEDFKEEYYEKIINISSEEYYLHMMKAWYFATALAKQYKSTLPILENNVLPVWVHNKSIQKAVESYRIDSEQKSYLKTLKRKI